jgi:hypothetical protein
MGEIINKPRQGALRREDVRKEGQKPKQGWQDDVNCN